MRITVFMMFIASMSFAGPDTNLAGSVLIETAVQPSSYFKANELQVGIFGTYGDAKHGVLRGAQNFVDQNFGFGAEVNYFVTKNWGFGIEGDGIKTGEDFDVRGKYELHSLSGNVFYRYPLEDSLGLHLAPYLFAGFDGNMVGPVIGGAHGGAGAEYRLSPNFGVFGDTRYELTTIAKDLTETRAGVRLAF